MTIGIYHLGCMAVRLCGRAGTGGDFDCGAKPQGLMRVGLSNDWPQVVNALMHEAFEASCCAGKHRWSPWPDRGFSKANALFVLTHEQMTEVIAEVAEFCTKAMPDLAEAYKRWSRKGRRDA